MRLSVATGLFALLASLSTASFAEKGLQNMTSIVLRLVLALAALTVVPNALAADTSSGNVFLDARYGALLGNDGYSGDVGSGGDSKTAWGADGGYLWTIDDGRLVGFEAGYTHFGQVSNDTDVLGFTSGNTTASALTAGVRFQALLGDSKATILQVHGGLVHAKFDSSFSYFPPGGPSGSGNDSVYENGVYFGAGIGRQLTQGFSVLLAYNLYLTFYSKPALAVRWIGLVAEYRF